MDRRSGAARRHHAGARPPTMTAADRRALTGRHTSPKLAIVNSFALAVILLLIASSMKMPAQTQAAATPRNITAEKVILDTDIGDDIDDAFALALLLSSPDRKS